jgi:hypothetical protein
MNRVGLAAVICLANFTLSCATPSPPDVRDWTPSPIGDVKSVTGAWEGILTSVGTRRDWVSLLIGEDGTYEFASYRPIGVLSGKGQFTVEEGKLMTRTEGGNITCSLYTANDRRMLKAEATNKKGVTYAAELLPVSR